MSALFAAQCREQEPQRRAAEHERAHDHIMPGILISIGQDIVKEVKRPEVRQGREKTVNHVQNLHETTHFRAEERRNAFDQKCDKCVYPEEDIHLHGDPGDASVVRMDQDAESDTHPDRHIEDHEHGCSGQESIAVRHRAEVVV